MLEHAPFAHWRESNAPFAETPAAARHCRPCRVCSYYGMVEKGGAARRGLERGATRRAMWWVVVES
jgi:hypothetical protein